MMRVLDPDALNQIRALDEPGQTGLLAEIVDAFRASSNGDLSRLRGALAVGDHDTVLDAAHRIRGAAAALGADRVRFIARALEMRGHQQSLAGATELVAELDTALKQALAALAQEVDS